MTTIRLLTAEHIVHINQIVCSQEKQDHICYGIGKVESAVGAAYYPGDYPFVHGGIAKVAGALCYYLIKAHAFFDGNKRTAMIAATTFMRLNCYKLIYPLNPSKNINELARVMDNCAASLIDKNELIEWFEQHKEKLSGEIRH